MSFFSGMSAGFGEGQGNYNNKMMDFANQKSQTMANLYGHLADNADDPDMQGEFARRAAGWATANPLMDPKGYKELVKGEKLGLHDIVDKNNQRKIGDYHSDRFGTGQPSQTQQDPAFSPRPTQGQDQGFQQRPQQPGAQAMSAPHEVPPSPIPDQDVTSFAPPPQAAQAGPVGPQGNIGQPDQAAPQQALPSFTPPPTPGGPPTGQPGQQPAPQAGGGAPDQSMDQYARSVIGQEPPAYGPTGRETMAHKVWRDAYTKRMEQTAVTPEGMKGFVGSHFMDKGFASPFATIQRAEISGNARLAGAGYKLGPDGHAVPLSPEEYSAVAQYKMNKDKAQAEEMAATTELRQSMSAYTTGKLKMIPVEMKVRLAQLGMQQEHLRLSELNTNAAIFGVDNEGKPIPGSVVMPDGTVVGQRFAHNVLPTGASQGKAETAIPVMQQTMKLEAFAMDPANQDLFGRVSGNLEAFLGGKNMTNDPREGPLRADLISLASLMVPLHGFRSQKAAEEFMSRLAQGMPPQGFVGALKAFNSVGQTLYDNGMPSLVGGGGTTVPRMPLPPGQATHKTNTTSTATQDDYRQAAIHAGWDGRPPVPPEIKKKAEDLLRKAGKIR